MRVTTKSVTKSFIYTDVPSPQHMYAPNPYYYYIRAIPDPIRRYLRVVTRTRKHRKV